MKKSVLTIVAVIGVIFATILRTGHARPQTAASSPGFEPGYALADPDLKLMDIDGKDISLADYKGKVVFVNFWATWCDPCRVEIPWLIDMQNKYGPKGFTVVGIAMDEEGEAVVAPFLDKERFDVDGAKTPDELSDPSRRR